MAGLARQRMRDDEVVPGDMRKSPEIHGVVEARTAGLKPLVATGGHDERVPRLDRLRHRLPQHKPEGTGLAMALHLNAQAAVCSAGEGQFPGSEPAVVEAVEPARRERRCRVHQDDGAGAAKVWLLRSIPQRPSPRSAEHVAV